MSFRPGFLVFMCIFILASAAGAQTFRPGSHSIAESGMISGTVVTTTGEPASGLQVDLRDQLGQIVATTTSAVDGGFEFRNVGFATYEVYVASGVQEARQRVYLQNGVELVTVRLPAGANRDDLAGVGGAHTVSVTQLKVPSKARKAYRKAQDALKKGDLAAALQRTEDALRYCADYPEALTLRAALKLDAGELEQASADLDRALKLDHSYPLAYIAMGALHNTRGNFDDALRVLDRGVALAPTSWRGYFELGRAQVGKGEFATAIRSLDKASDFAPQVYPLIHLTKAHALLGLELYSDAMNELQVFLTRSPAGPNSEHARKTLDQVRAFTAGSRR